MFFKEKHLKEIKNCCIKLLFFFMMFLSVIYGIFIRKRYQSNQADTVDWSVLILYFLVFLKIYYIRYVNDGCNQNLFFYWFFIWWKMMGFWNYFDFFFVLVLLIQNIDVGNSSNLFNIWHILIKILPVNLHWFNFVDLFNTFNDHWLFSWLLSCLRSKF